MIEAIIFDCDGVLVDSETLLEKVDLAFLERLGLQFTRDEYHHHFTGSTYEDNIRVISEKHLEVHGIPAPQTIADDLSRMRVEVLEKELTAINGTVELLEVLKLKRAVASNTMKNDWLNRKLAKTKLEHYFDKHIYAAENVARGKPHPDLYLFAAEKLGVAPEHCLVVEDSPRGVEAGVAAGMKVVGFLGASHFSAGTHEEKLLNAGAERVFQSMGDFKIYLDELLAA